MSKYQRLFDAMNEAEELQDCLHAVEELTGTDNDLSARMNGGRDRLATLLGRLLRQQQAALADVRTAFAVIRGDAAE